MLLFIINLSKFKVYDVESIIITLPKKNILIITFIDLYFLAYYFLIFLFLMKLYDVIINHHAHLTLMYELLSYNACGFIQLAPKHLCYSTFKNKPVFYM